MQWTHIPHEALEGKEARKQPIIDGTNPHMLLIKPFVHCKSQLITGMLDTAVVLPCTIVPTDDIDRDTEKGSVTQDRVRTGVWWRTLYE